MVNSVRAYLHTDVVLSTYEVPVCSAPNVILFHLTCGNLRGADLSLPDR